jgi:UDP-N-acetylglucosamine 2-epimerase (non-hydrolysing)
MPKPIKIMSVVGARPNFMKIAPIVAAIKKFNDSINQGNPGNPINHLLVHTGQHYDVKMSEAFFRDLGIPDPDINMEVGSGSHALQTAQIMIKAEEAFIKEKPDWIVVVGDVNSTMACTLVASKLGIRVAHVEAGLRSFDRTMPEEINRLVTDALADLLLTPSRDADENLIREGVHPSKIRLVGNIMIDTLVANLDRSRSSRLPELLGLKLGGFAYVTLHRPSNVDDRASLEAIMTELKRLSDDLTVIFPVHPRTRKMLEEYEISLNGSRNLKILDPVGYHDSLYLTEHARFVLTDSGGLQEESTFLRTPCLTLRPNTERPVTIAEGTNKLTTIEALTKDIEDILEGRRNAGEIPEFWDGHTAERVIDSLLGASLAHLS